MWAIDKEFSTITEVQQFCHLLEKNTDTYLLENPNRSYRGVSRCIVGEIVNILEKWWDHALTEVNGFMTKFIIWMPSLLETIQKTRHEVEKLSLKQNL